MTALALKKINDEVFLAEDDIVRLDRRYVDFVKEKAITNQRGRARICAHKSPDDNLHEMIIAIREDSYIRPHRHHNKIESFHLIEGSADIVILDEICTIKEVIRLSAQHNFYYRLSTPQYHTLILHSPVLVIHEITNGPFIAETSDFASYSPTENQLDEVAHFIQSIREKINAHISIGKESSYESI